MANKIQLRRDTAANWARINPILADGEPGLDITNNKTKYGDGTTEWNLLPFSSGGDPVRLVNDTAVVTLDANGVLNVPGEIHSTDGVTITTGRGEVQFGANLEAPGAPTHFHINKTGATAGNTDLFFGDDSDYLKLPSNGGVVIGADGTMIWEFNVAGGLVLPDNGFITGTVGTDGTPLNISNITYDSGANQVTVTTSVEHGITQLGTKVFITGLTRCTQLNDSSFYVVSGTNTSFILYTDVNLDIPFDGSVLTEPYSTAGNRSATSSGVTNGSTDETPFTGETTLYFGGAGYVRFQPSNDFDFNVGPFSVSFWVYPLTYNNGRIFTFGTWPTETLGMSNEGAGTPYIWINGNNFGAGQGLSINTWHHVLINRFENTMSFSIDGVTLNSFPGIGYDLYMAATKSLTIGNDSSGGAPFTGYIRDFKINVGQGIDTSTLTVPTGPATADSPYTKVLLLSTASDSSGSSTVTGGGTVTEKIPGSSVLLTVAESSNGSDFSDVILSTGSMALTVSGKHNYVAVSNPGGDYPINSSGQGTINIDVASETNPIDATTTLNWQNNVWYIQPDPYYTDPTGVHTIQVPLPERVGVEVSIINDTPASIVIVDFDGPIWQMGSWEVMKMISYRDSTGQIWWWMTSSFSW